MMKHLSILALSVATAALLGGCEFSSILSPNNTKQTNNEQNSVTNPIIQALAPNPTAVATKSDVMTFTVTAHAPDGSALDYTWTATKGYLSSTKGQIISWTPQKADGSLEAGIATIQVLVSNGKGGTAQGSVNIKIEADGSASKQ